MLFLYTKFTKIPHPGFVLTLAGICKHLILKTIMFNVMYIMIKHAPLINTG